MRNRYLGSGRHSSGVRHDASQAEAAVPPNYMGCPRRRGGPVRDKARSLPAMAGCDRPARSRSGFGITALIPASGHDPAAGGRAAAVGAASVLPGSAQLTSATLPLAATQPSAQRPHSGPAARPAGSGPDGRGLDIVAFRHPGQDPQAARRDLGPVHRGGQDQGQRQVRRRAGGRPVHVPRLCRQDDRSVRPALAERGRGRSVGLLHDGQERQAAAGRHRARGRGQAGEPAGRRVRHRGHRRHRRRGL